MSMTTHISVPVEPNAPLSKYTTFQLGGPCKAVIHVETAEQIEEAIQYLISKKEKFILIGGGSNLVVSDVGLDCYVIRFTSSKPLIHHHGGELSVVCSTSLDDLALYAVTHGLEGLTYTSGIPGTVGGAIVGNAGAFGQQVGDVLKSVTVITLKGEKKTLLNKDLGFSYRDSLLKKSGDIVVEAVFHVTPANPQDLLKQRADLLAQRRVKHPDLKTHPCAGSFFRNIEPTSKAGKRQATGWFLEQAGGKTLSFGGAKIFDKHANIIVKDRNCHAQDIYELSILMQALVKNHFQLEIIREVRFVGHFENMPKDVSEMIW
jgi:UDP-N-acetylmuramate dehydrogenase